MSHRHGCQDAVKSDANDKVFMEEEFAQSRIPSKQKEKMLVLIREGESLNSITRETGLPKTTIYYYFRKIKGRTHSIADFTSGYSKEDGEIAGIFAGDGSQTKGKKCNYCVNIHFGETDYIFYVKDLYEKYFNKEFRLAKYKNGTPKLVTHSKKIFYHFHKYLDYVPSSKHCTVKLKMSNLTDEFLVGFLKGFLDTDGTIAFPKDRKIRVGYFTTSEELSKQLELILNKFNIGCGRYVNSRKGYKDIYQLFIYADAVDSFLNLVKPYKIRRLGPVW